MVSSNKVIMGMLMSFALIACSQDADQVQQLETEVMAIHDEVMPSMDDLMRLKKQLNEKLARLDSLQQEGVSSSTLAQERTRAFELSRDLTVADSLMMEWMYRYRGDSAKALPAEEALRYFNQEKEKINIVKEQTNRSIQEAEAFLK